MHGEKLVAVRGGDEGAGMTDLREEDRAPASPPAAGGVFRRAALVVNTRSRAGEQAFRTALGLLDASGVPLGTTYDLRDPARLVETVREVLEEDHDLVILGGGDGSISSVVDLLVGREVTLGLLPLGTANDFARTLGIPFGLEEAISTIAHGRVAEADLGLVGDNYYANVASVGVSAGVTQALTPLLKRRAGAMAYPLAAVKALRRHKPFSASLTFPDGDHEPVILENLLQLAVGNGRFYGGGMVVAPDSDIDDSSLDVYAIEAGRRRDLVRVALGLRSGEFVKEKGVHYWRTARVLVETFPRLPINVDGELVSQTPRPFSVAPNALKVLVPQPPAACRDGLLATPGEPLLTGPERSLRVVDETGEASSWPLIFDGLAAQGEINRLLDRVYGDPDPGSTGEERREEQ